MFANLLIYYAGENITSLFDRTCAIITCGLYTFYPIFEDHFFVFMEFFQKILALCMDSAQEQFVIKSELLCQAYGICTSLEYNPT